MNAHPWKPDILDTYKYVENERQWLLMEGEGGKKLAFLHCYIACQSFTSDDFLRWNQDLFQMITLEALQLREEGYMILAMGDFNSHVGRIDGLEGNKPSVNDNEPMFTSFVEEVNLCIINTLPLCDKVFTFFRGEKASLLDYGLIDTEHVHLVQSFNIDEGARHLCGSDHALLECELLFQATTRTNWRFKEEVFKYNFNDTTDFTRYKDVLDAALKTISLHDFIELPIYDKLRHITSSITSTAKNVFGLKVRKKKKGIRLPKAIRADIKAKEVVSSSLHKAYLQGDQAEVEKLLSDLTKLKEKVYHGISGMRLRKRRMLRAKLLKNDPSRRKFWRFIRNRIKNVGQITALRDKVQVTTIKSF